MATSEISRTLGHDKFTKFLQAYPDLVAVAPPEFLLAIAGEEIIVPDSVRWFAYVFSRGTHDILDLTKRKRLFPGTYTMSTPFLVVSTVIIYDPDNPHRKIVTAPQDEPCFLRIEQNSLSYVLMISNPTESPFYISPDRYRQIEEEERLMWDQ